jgi:hypothetical protein
MEEEEPITLQSDNSINGRKFLKGKTDHQNIRLFINVETGSVYSLLLF